MSTEQPEAHHASDMCAVPMSPQALFRAEAIFSHCGHALTATLTATDGRGAELFPVAAGIHLDDGCEGSTLPPSLQAKVWMLSFASADRREKPRLLHKRSFSVAVDEGVGWMCCLYVL